jgi:hypothetical protein
MKLLSVQALQAAIREAYFAIDFSAGFANPADLSLDDGASNSKRRCGPRKPLPATTQPA